MYAGFASRALRGLLLFGAMGLGLAGCCGDGEAQLTVHVIDGENGYLIPMPSISADGDTLRCEDSTYYADPVPAPGEELDGGTVVPPPGATDMKVGPPPKSNWCESYRTTLEAGYHTVVASAPGYFGNTVQVDMGKEGDSFSCPDARDVEITIALYKKPD